MKKNYLSKGGFLVLLSLAFLNSCNKNTEEVQLLNVNKQEKVVEEQREEKITSEKHAVVKTVANKDGRERQSEIAAVKSDKKISAKEESVIKESSRNVVEKNIEEEQPILGKDKNLITEEDVYARKPKSGGAEFGERRQKGIEQMAEYRRMITMPIGATKSDYKPGYVMSEYNKALKSDFLAQSKNKKTARGYSAQAVTFTERGPVNVPGRTRASIVSPTNPDKWYVGTVGGGVWITENAGQTWRNTTDTAVPSLSTGTLAISPSNANIVYAGTGEPFGNLDRVAGIGIFKSTDAGETWSYLTNTSAFGDIGRLIINPNDANHLIVGTSSGIYVTTNGGTTWAKTLASGNAQDFAASNDFSAIYAGVNGVGVYKSTDAGTTWTKTFDAVAENKSLGRIELDISPVDNTRLFLGIYGNNTTNFYKSDDSGTTFSAINFGTGDNNVLAGQGWYDNVMRAHPLDKNVFYAGGVYMCKVTVDPVANTYATKPIAGGYGDITGQINKSVHVDMHDIIYKVNPADPTQFRLIITNDGGVYSTGYKTNPGETEGDWSAKVTGLNSTQFYGADKKKGEDAYLAGAQDNGSYISETTPSSATTNYTLLWGGDGFETIWNYADPTKVMMSSQYSNIVRYLGEDGYYARTPDYGSAKSPFYSKLANANNNPDVVFTPSSSGVWRSTNFGGSWVLAPITGGWLGSASPVAVSVSVANPNIVWAGVVMSSSSTSAYKLRLSKDNGQTFTSTVGVLPSQFTSAGYYISGLQASAVSESRAFVLFSSAGKGKIFKTDDFGATFTDITGFTQGENRGFPDVPVHSVLEMPFDPNIIWAGTDIGVFETTDAGASWHILTGLPPVSVWQMKIVDDQVVMATHGRGVWTATVPQLAGYVLPDYVKMPSITKTMTAGIHDMKGKITYSYTDSRISAVKVYVDNVYVETVTGLSPNTTYTYTTASTLTEGTHSIGVSGVYDTNKETAQDKKALEIINFNAGASNVVINEFATTDVYVGAGKFVVDKVASKFTYNVLNNSGHPYANNTTYQTYLRTPIIVGANSKLNLKQIALTEGGDADHPTPYDPAIVEASKDLVTWTTVGTYSEDSFANWKNNGASLVAADVNESLFQTSVIDLSSKFAVGDEVVLRFRLTTDPGTTAYGWIIKSINEGNLAVGDSVMAGDEVSIAPNPILDDINIYLPASSGWVTVSIYDATGRQIQSVQKKPENNKIQIPFGQASKGMYMIVVKGDKINKSLKVIKK